MGNYIPWEINKIFDVYYNSSSRLASSLLRQHFLQYNEMLGLSLRKKIAWEIFEREEKKVFASNLSRKYVKFVFMYLIWNWGWIRTRTSNVQT